jgi:NADPH2:quinone reductase
MVRAVVVHEFGPPESIAIEEIASLTPGPGEVLIDVEAVGVNFVDLLVVGGKYQFLPQRPFTPGKLPAGTIIALGKDVQGIAIGDRVLTTAEQGGYAEQAVAPAAQCYRIPDRISFVQTASIALGFDTAWFALHERGRLRAGESVLVLGATGSVGFAAVQLAKVAGAQVIAGVSSRAKAQLALDVGADDVVDLSVMDIHNGLREQVHALTDGKGVDVVIDSLGDRFLPAALRALAWCGRLVVVGFAAGKIASVKTNYLLVKNIEVSGLQVSDYRKKMPSRMRECFAEIFAMLEKGVLRAPACTVLPLDSFADALGSIRDRRAAGRIVLEPNGRQR